MKLSGGGNDEQCRARSAGEFAAWLDALGTPLTVQQRAMRHGNIRITMNTYGDLIGDELRLAHSRVVGSVIGPKLDRKHS